MTNRYEWFFAMDAPTRTRPMDWSSVVAHAAPAQLVAYVNRHSQDSRHHWHDPSWLGGVDTWPHIDRELLRIRGGVAKRFPGMEVN